MASKIQKGIVIIFIANLIELSLSVLRNLILPKYTSVDTYADIKTYQLYISYISFAALGYVDGMHLKYGGKSISIIDKKELQDNVSTFRWLELTLSIIVSFIAIILNETILLFAGLTIFAYNISNYYRSMFQATGEYAKYTRSMNISAILLFCVNMVLLFVFHSDISIQYIVAYVIVYYIVWVIIEISFYRIHFIRNVFSFSSFTFKQMIKDGFLLMCGLYISSLMTGLDSWCVKFLMTSYDFAIYSFAASMEGFLSYALSPLGVTLYNYFCTHENDSNRIFIKKEIQVFTAFLISGAFAIEFLLEIFIQKYLPAKNVLFILFAAFLFYGIITCFYLNIFKSQRKQNDLFKLTLIILIMGLVFNLLLFWLLGLKEAFSLGTLLSAIMWYILCERKFKEYRDKTKDVLYLVLITLSYLISGMLFISYIGFLIYVTLYILLSFLLHREALINILIVGRGIINSRMKKNEKKNSF